MKTKMIATKQIGNGSISIKSAHTNCNVFALSCRRSLPLRPVGQPRSVACLPACLPTHQSHTTLPGESFFPGKRSEHASERRGTRRATRLTGSGRLHMRYGTSVVHLCSAAALASFLSPTPDCFGTTLSSSARVGCSYFRGSQWTRPKSKEELNWHAKGC